MIRRLVRALLVDLAGTSERLWVAVQPQCSPSTEADVDDGWDCVQCCDHACTVDVDSPVPEGVQVLDFAMCSLEFDPQGGAA